MQVISVILWNNKNSLLAYYFRRLFFCTNSHNCFFSWGEINDMQFTGKPLLRKLGPLLGAFLRHDSTHTIIRHFEAVWDKVVELLHLFRKVGHLRKHMKDVSCDKLLVLLSTELLTFYKSEQILILMMEMVCDASRLCCHSRWQHITKTTPSDLYCMHCL